MKILIVDDNTAKAGKLANVFSAEGVAEGDIEVVNSASAARTALSKTLFDLLVIDLLLPLRAGDDPNCTSSTDLVREIAERDTLKNPRVIVGFTAYQDAEQVARLTFQERMWTIVFYDETSSSWERQFQNVTQYLKTSAPRTAPTEYTVDVCLVTALSTEMDAFLNLPWNWEEPVPIDDQTFIRRGEIVVGKESFSIIAATSARMGSVASALLVSKLISHFRPRFVVMGGICAGVKSKAKIGDAIFFDPVWEWPCGKLTAVACGTYLEPAPHQINATEFLAARAAELVKDESLPSLVTQRWKGKAGQNSPKFIVGPGASGSAVVADNKTVDAIKLQHRKLTAVEMEAYGVFAAARDCSSPKPSVMVVKAVCDFADERKNDGWQAYASFTSANYLAIFLEKYLPTIKPLCGT